jgi:putative spermidine/putrescine transport system substrate-binding protein
VSSADGTARIALAKPARAGGDLSAARPTIGEHYLTIPKQQSTPAALVSAAIVEEATMSNHRISRRQFVTLAGSSLAGAAAGPFVLRRARAAGKEVVVCSWGGTYQKALRKAYFDPFEKETGVKVIDTSAPEVAKVKAQVDSKNPEWDVIEAGTRWYFVLVNQGFVQPLDLKKFNTAPLLPEAVLGHGIGHNVVGMTLAYNTKLFTGEAPNSWADFWNVKKFPGPRSMGAEVTFALEFALLADGVAAEKLYPIDVERAFRKLAEIKPHVKVWWKHGDQPTQLLSQGEVVMAPAWNGRVVAAQDKGLPVGLTWNQGCFQPSYWYMLQGARRLEEAYQFIDFTIRAKPQAELAQEIPYGPTNRNALDLVPLAQRKRLPSYPENIKVMWPLNGEWLGKHYDAVNDRWQKFLLG